MDIVNNTSSGKLKFGVFSRENGGPIKNARIKITRTKDTEVIESSITDISGQTLEINLDAPATTFSMEPQEVIRPYSEYFATIQADGFNDYAIDGIEIFENILAIQNSFLTPTIPKVDDTEDVIIIGENTLWGDYPPKIPESAVKDVGPSTGFVVLDEVVIPEFIVVHDGLPDDKTAPNYYIPYKDYLKNVASCEIYSTWSDATIRANILAIISFTLNRVYTEWYRNKGKNFTITSTTSYDHKFIYGRNIFDNISLIVDEMFATYVTKEGIRQPLFTQYCDGKKVTCPGWMSQWGSKFLGDEGYSAVDILKNYYGYDIYLKQATEVLGIPSSFPGTNLQVGSRGKDVRTIQEQLNRIANDFPAIPKVRADGIYGENTRKSVEKFQEVFNLPGSGIVDYPTWYKISDIFVGVSRLAN